MTDEKYVFEETSRERKRVGTGAYSRKRGSRSKKCTLPSDNMTAGQLKKRNGEVMQYNLKAPMGWLVFRSMPADLQKEYIKSCAYKYEARGCDMAEMFGISRNGFSAAMVGLFGSNTPFTGASRKKTSPLWEEFIRGDISVSAEPTPAAVNSPVEAKESSESETERVKQMPSLKSSAELCIKSGTLRFAGTPEAVFAKAILAMNPMEAYEVEIRFRRTTAQSEEVNAAE